MSFLSDPGVTPIFILVFSFIGLAAVFAAFGLWRRDSGYSPFWLVSRPGLGVLCLLAGGGGLIAGGHYRLSRWTPIQGDILGAGALSPRVVIFLATCLGLLSVGAALRALGGRRAVHGQGPVPWCLAVAP